MKTKSLRKFGRKQGQVISFLMHSLLTTLLLLFGLAPAAGGEAGKTEETDAEKAAEPAEPAEEETKEEEKAEKLSPEEMFEGGAKPFENWVEGAFGGFIQQGSKAQFQQRHRTDNDVFGGIQDFHFQQGLGKAATLAVDGGGIFDNRDYRLSLDLTHEKTGFLRLNYENFRTWYNGTGGYYSPGDVFYSLSEDALALDRGQFSVEAGLTWKNIPPLTFRYTHRYRDGEKSSTIWGPTHPLGPGSTLVRGLSPSFYDLDEQADIFELEGTHRIKKTDLGLGLRYETGDLDNGRKMTFWPGEAEERKVTDRERTSYDLFNVHAFTETWIKQNLFFSSGFSFSDLDNSFSGSRTYGDDFDVGYTPIALNGLGYQDLSGDSRKQEYVLNLNLFTVPFKQFTLVPSVRVMREDWKADSMAIQTSGANPASGFLNSNTDGDLLDVRERLELRYSGITNWVLFARGEWTQGQGNLDETGGLGLTPPIQRETEDNRFFQKYSLGARWYAHRRVAVDVGGYYKNNQYDYDHDLDSTANNAGNRYPAYLAMQNFETLDGNVRLTLRPVQKVSLMSRYEFQTSNIDTKPASASGLGEVESSEMLTHIFAQNVTWTPWARLYLQAGFNFVVSETKTPASDVTQAILNAQNNYWTLNFSTGVVLDDKTDLNLSYFYYTSDNYDDNSAFGLPYGAEAQEHGITATLVRRITANLRLTLRYGFFHYDDTTSGNNNDYQAHVISSALQYRF
ncbi:MAG: hypothetical protein KJ070_03675 [Verrucomicrobia bacterium]|nr:hypothetical protein [Verrucomicrobiota bacterium]